VRHGTSPRSAKKAEPATRGVTDGVPLANHGISAAFARPGPSHSFPPETASGAAPVPDPGGTSPREAAPRAPGRAARRTSASRPRPERRPAASPRPSVSRAPVRQAEQPAAVGRGRRRRRGPAAARARPQSPGRAVPGGPAVPRGLAAASAAGPGGRSGVVPAARRGAPTIATVLRRPVLLPPVLRLSSHCSLHGRFGFPSLLEKRSRQSGQRAVCSSRPSWRGTFQLLPPRPHGAARAALYRPPAPTRAGPRTWHCARSSWSASVGDAGAEGEEAAGRNGGRSQQRPVTISRRHGVRGGRPPSLSPSPVAAVVPELPQERHTAATIPRDESLVIGWLILEGDGAIPFPSQPPAGVAGPFPVRVGSLKIVFARRLPTAPVEAAWDRAPSRSDPSCPCPSPEGEQLAPVLFDSSASNRRGCCAFPRSTRRPAASAAGRLVLEGDGAIPFPSQPPASPSSGRSRLSPRGQGEQNGALRLVLSSSLVEIGAGRRGGSLEHGKTGGDSHQEGGTDESPAAGGVLPLPSRRRRRVAPWSTVSESVHELELPYRVSIPLIVKLL
jgi:hypothetical protein